MRGDAMKAKVGIEIKATKEAIWAFITDESKWVDNIKAILEVEVKEKPETFLGFKWKETREMFGKKATEIMWVTDMEENKYYVTRAESHGAVYITRVTIEEKEETCILSQSFEGIPQKLMGKIMMGLMGGMMKKSTEKAVYEDLVDIKNYVENK
jgi:hypothetical protein